MKVAALTALAWLFCPLGAHAQSAWRIEDGVSAPDWLTLNGSFRARYETLDNQFRPGLTGGDQLVSLRTTLFAEGKFASFRVGAELHDARAYLGDEGGAVSTGEVNALEFPQAYLGWRFDDVFAHGAQANMQLGRFTMDLGSRRLVGRNSFRNTTNAFTGARVDWGRPEGAALTAFYALPHTRLPNDQASLLANEAAFDRESADLAFWGAIGTSPHLPFGARGEAFVFVLDERDGGGVASADRHLVTPGLRFYRDPAAGAWDFEIEAGVQRGERRATASASDVIDLDVSAAYAHVEWGYRWDAAWSPRVAFEYDFASGDRSPSDREYGRFDSLYGPRRPDFGPPGIYGPLGRANVSSPGVRVEVTPSQRWDGFVFWRALLLDEPADSFANTGIRDSSGVSGDFAGHQIEARVRYWILPHSVRLEAGAATLIQGAFLERAPNRTGEGDTLYGYGDITWTF